GIASGSLTNWQEIGAYIRDLSQLTEADLKILRILYDSQNQLFQVSNFSINPNDFTQKMPEVLEAVDKAKLSKDDFYARCSRLNGFGLALEVQRNDGRFAPWEHCFRMTGRGYELVKMLALQESL